MYDPHFALREKLDTLLKSYAGHHGGIFRADAVKAMTEAFADCEQKFLAKNNVVHRLRDRGNKVKS